MLVSLLCLKMYDKYSQNIVCEYDEEWYKNDFQIEDKKINHLLMFVYQKGKNLQKELDLLTINFQKH